MSWDSYIDNLLAQCKDTSGTSHCDKAVIIGIDGGAPWTSATHPAVSISNKLSSIKDISPGGILSDFELLKFLLLFEMKSCNITSLENAFIFNLGR